MDDPPDVAVTLRDGTKISWSHYTHNPWIGCVRVSPGCDHCYTEARDQRFDGGTHWGRDAGRRVTSDANWRKPLSWDRKARAAGVRHRVFCASLADVFEGRDDLDPVRERLWSLIESTTNLDWLLLTKRPQNIRRMVPSSWLDAWPSFVWPGTTVENQRYADLRVAQLVDVPAAVRFLSCEPLLGPVDLSAWMPDIGWVIAGGESGPHARPPHPSWFHDLRDQCVGADVPYHFKQWGEWGESWRVDPVRPGATVFVDRDGGVHDAYDTSPGVAPSGWCGMNRAGVNATGRVLDGRVWDAVPSTPTPEPVSLF